MPTSPPLPHPDRALWLPNAASSLLALQPPLVWPLSAMTTARLEQGVVEVRKWAGDGRERGEPG